MYAVGSLFFFVVFLSYRLSDSERSVSLPLSYRLSDSERSVSLPLSYRLRERSDRVECISFFSQIRSTTATPPLGMTAEYSTPFRSLGMTCWTSLRAVLRDYHTSFVMTGAKQRGNLKFLRPYIPILRHNRKTDSTPNSNPQADFPLRSKPLRYCNQRTHNHQYP